MMIMTGRRNFTRNVTSKYAATNLCRLLSAKRPLQISLSVCVAVSDMTDMCSTWEHLRYNMPPWRYDITVQNCIWQFNVLWFVVNNYNLLMLLHFIDSSSPSDGFSCVFWPKFTGTTRGTSRGSTPRGSCAPSTRCDGRGVINRCFWTTSWLTTQLSSIT